ncbi:type IV toxin-antitoxin system AbiEi family antitoxin domain-containing protein [Leucobacter soli]|uniref:Very-short-patch-repair endonuclease n=1 Tax=Leucobacter soli TaxID=2812850 RepID=A0A916NI49_9MICO|nr:type IV toxin-antitoxin system AbiEi family antitoxin domain-containing protein [Leucobacter soli]CAG7614144.1 hypothetical protein LEUCIP111803_01760 [Leucobacter soli]
MLLLEKMRAADGIVRSRDLQAQGVSRHAIAKAVRAGTVRRLRRNWITLPDTDGDLQAAADRGVILSCVTQARRLGLWVPERPKHPHVAAPGGRHIEAPSCRVHWSAPIVPRTPSTLEDPLENVLMYTAKCQSHDFALAIWESALNKQLIDYAKLESLPFVGAARDLVRECSPHADSGLESIFRTRLAWLRVPIRPQIWLYGHRVDLFIGDRLVVQIDGRDHVGAQRTADNKHDIELKLRGYHVIRVSYEQIMFDWPSVQFLVQEAVARGLHLAKRRHGRD